MSAFHYSFPIPPQEPKIEIGNIILLIGSCFSDEIGKQAQIHGLNATSNPFGTLFHPLAIGQTISDSLADNKTVEYVQQDDVFFHWGSSGKIHAYSMEELHIKVIQERKNFKEKLQKATHLFITFGTAKGYHHTKSNHIVANCHKQNPSLFEIKNSNTTEIIQHWKPILKQLLHINPNIQIVFTVSPVRHLKDGIIENNRSKAQLILAVATLSKLPNCNYFPSYEIVMDELRDYRFFKNDYSHPNELAINFIWERFSDTFISQNTEKICTKIRAIKNALNHITLYEKSAKTIDFQEFTKEKKAQLNREIRGIYW